MEHINKTIANRFSEHVEGEIIGDFYVTGQLYYDGRPQGFRIHADNDHLLRIEAKRYKDEMVARNVGICYGQDLWELRWLK